MEVLSREVYLDFLRAMNSITFNRTVKAMPEAFPFVTLPDEPEPEYKASGSNLQKLNRTSLLFFVFFSRSFS